MATDDLSTIAQDGEVTKAEAQAVLDGHLEILNPAIIDVLANADRTDGIPTAFYDTVLRLYGEAWANVIVETWQEGEAADFPNINTTDPTGYEDTVVKVIDVYTSCIYLKMERNFNGVRQEPTSPAAFWVELQNDTDQPPNPTGWHKTNERGSKPDAGLCVDGEDS